MEKGTTDVGKYSGRDVILVSVDKKSGVINAIWPAKSRLHGIAGKHCIGKKITSFFTPASRKLFKQAVTHRKKFRNITLHLEFFTKKAPAAIYDCSLWQSRHQPLMLVIRKPLLYSNDSPRQQVKEVANTVMALTRERFRIFEMLPMAIIVSDQRGNIFFINSTFTRLFGFTHDNIPSLDNWLFKTTASTEAHFLNGSHIYNMDWFQKLPGAEPAGPNFMRHEQQLHCLNGGIKEMEIFCHVCPDDHNLYLVFNDLTKKKKAEHLLNQAEEKFRRIIEKIPIPISAYEIAPPKRFQFINPTFTKWFGYSMEDMPDIAHWKILAFRDESYYKQKEKEWYEEFDRIRRGEIIDSRPFEFTIYCKDGTIKEVEISFTIDDNLFYTTYNDITARKKFERALRENERQFRNISEQLPIPIAVFTDTHETRFLNNAFTTTFGYVKEDIPTQEEWMIKAYPDEAFRKQIKADWKRDLPKHVPEPDSIEIRQYEITCKNGEKKIAELFISAGNKNMYIAFHDISAKVKAEQELKQSHRQLRELSSYLENIREEERKHISREIHDELGQQLTLLKLDLLQLGKKLPPEVGHDMKKADDLLAETMRSVRKIATQLRPSILDNLGLVSALEWQSREFEKNFGIRCVFESLLGEPIFNEKQSNALFRIYQEALTNIARHSGATRVDAVLSQEGNNVVLEVRDNGKGFPTTNAEGKKTLGLVGMQERALMMDGDFRIESMPGQGTYIFVSIPMSIPNTEINYPC
jgi:PAS domain S-box-containing protein